ncbi:MAG TPA: AAA family ATPase [Solirubrobacteraceae bacterium]
MRAGELLERQAELGALSGALDAAAAGRGALAVVEGTAGIGKSRLLAWVRDEARERGMRVGFARGAELEREFPFAVLRQLLDPLVTAAGPEAQARLFAGGAELARPVLARDAGARRLPDADALYGTLQALHWLVVALAAAGPLALVVDDLQWADDASLAAVAFLVRRLEGLPVALVAGTRPAAAEGRPALAALAAEPDAVVLRPRALTADAVHTWLAGADRAMPPDDAFVEACRVATGGNPLLLKELVHELREEGVEPTAERVERVRRLSPRGISTIVLLRLGRLPPDATALARAVAVLGDDARVDDAAALAGLAPGAARDTAGSLVAADVLDDAEPLRYAHPVIRAAVLEDIPALERAALHARAAARLRDAGASAERVAAHLVHADRAELPWATGVLRAAADAAFALGEATAAARWLTAALEAPLPAAERGAVLEQLGRAEALSGDPAAAAHLEEAVALARSDDEATDRAVVLGTAHKMAGRGRAATDALTRALARVPEGSVAAQRLEAEIVGAGFLDPAAARVAREHVGRLRAHEGPPADDQERLVLALLAWDAATGPDGDAAATAALAERALGIEHAGADPIPGGQGLIVAGMALVVADRAPAADALFGELFEHARRTGAGAAAGGALGMRAWARLRLGRIAEAEADALAALDLGTQLHARAVLGNPPLAVATYVAAERGRSWEDVAALHAHPGVAAAADVMSSGLVRHAVGRLHAAEGRHAQALAELEACSRDEPWWGRDLPSLLPWRSDGALCLLALGDAERARALADEEVALARAFGAPRALGVALRAAALVRDGDERVGLLEEAERVLAPAGARVESARVLADLGAERRRSGGRADARDLLTRALETAARAGADRLADRARQELRATGARPRRDVASGVGALTPAERRVAGRAAEGLGNREIAQALWLSEKTVETHMSSILRKLGLRSRADVAAALDEAAVA